MDEQMIELQPCPWCCEEWIKVRSENSACFAAECQGCAAYGPEASTQAEAIASWNRRSAHSVMAGKVAELEALFSQARADNPYPPFSDESGPWNEGFCTAWEVTRAALAPHPKGME